MWNYANDSRISCVGSDNYLADQNSARHILELGHRDIALVFPPTGGNDRAAFRLAGATDALAEAGVCVPANWKLETQYSIAKAKRACLELYRQSETPSALIAQGAVFAVAKAGIQVPQSLSIAGIGDFAGSAEIVPALTTVQVQSDEIGHKAALMLDALISEPEHQIVREKIDLKFVPRQTTCPLGVVAQS